MKPATFIFSLDCEGKWGAADRLDETGYRRFTTAALETVYRRLVHLFDRYEVPATFAFVSSFYLTPDEAHAHADWFEPVDYGGNDWFAAFRSDFQAGQHDGWFCPAALDAVLSSGGHEVASHGFSHVPLGESDIDEDAFRREMELIRETEALRGIETDTFIYPRNRIGYLPLLPQYGYRGYRPPSACDSGRGAVGKVLRYANELNPFEPLQRQGEPGVPPLLPPLPLPPGRMLLVRSGNRRWIPPAVIKRKYEIMLDRAIAGGCVVHVFTHPHNFMTGVRQYEVLEGLLRAVAQRARSGELRIATQRDYCEQLFRAETAPSEGNIAVADS